MLLATTHGVAGIVTKQREVSGMLDEDLCSLTQATHFTPGRPHVSTFHRWWKVGIGGIRLETVKIGGRRYTSKEAIKRFVQRTSAGANPTPCAVPRRDTDVESELDKEGL